MASLDHTDELVFRLRTDVIRLNRENAELRRRLNIPLDGRCIPVDKAVDRAVDTVNKSTVDTSVVDISPAKKSRAEYQREWQAARRAAEKNKTDQP